MSQDETPTIASDRSWFTHPTTPGTSREADFWPTPAHAIESLLDSDPPPKGRLVLEPAAGDGAIVRVLLERGYRVTAIEIRACEIPQLQALCPAICGDFLGPRPHELFADGRPVLTNPPFSLWRQFAARSLELQPNPTHRYIALLLRCNTLGSGPAAEFWNNNPPSAIRPLKRRPSFSGDGKTDGAEYAWIIWDHRPPVDLKVI
jgi:hypothetical protein